MKFVLFFLCSLHFCNAGSDKLPMETLHDALNSLKDSGVLNQFEEQLKDLLIKENDRKEQEEFNFLQVFEFELFLWCQDQFHVKYLLQVSNRKNAFILSLSSLICLRKSTTSMRRYHSTLWI